MTTLDAPARAPAATVPPMADRPGPATSVGPAGIGEPLAEAAVLGCLLRTTRAHAAGLLAELADEDFTVPQHRHVARAARTLLARGEPVDPVTVLGQLRRQGLEDARTTSTSTGVLLVELCEAAPAVGSAGYYARIVVEHSYRRRVQQAAARLLDAAQHASLAALAELIVREHAGITDEHRRLSGPLRTAPDRHAPGGDPCPR